MNTSQHLLHLAKTKDPYRVTQRFLQLALLAAFATAAHAQRGPGGAPQGGHGIPGGNGGAMGMPSGINGGNNSNGNNRPSEMSSNNGSSSVSMGGGMSRGPRLGPQGRWWDDKKTSHTLGLRSEQQQHMDSIFEANKAHLLTLYSNYQSEERKLSSMSSADLADESKVFASIDRVAQARAEVEKENAHILLQIRKELDGQQLAKLDSELSAR